MALVLIGSIAAITDAVAASLVAGPTATRSAVDARIGSRVAGAVAAAVGSSQTVKDAAAHAIINDPDVREAIGWQKSPLGGSDSIDDLAPGFYTRVGSIDTAQGYPFSAGAGTSVVEVPYWDGTNGFQKITSVLPDGTVRSLARRHSSGGWSDWYDVSEEWKKSPLDTTTHLDTIVTAGVYLKVNDTGTVASRGYPAPAAGVLHVIGEGDYLIQVYESVGQGVHLRRRVGGVFDGWVRTTWSGGRALGGGTDLNAIDAPGVHQIIAASVTGAPAGWSGTEMVLEHLPFGSTWAVQRVTNEHGITQTRTRRGTSPSDWTRWSFSGGGGGGTLDDAQIASLVRGPSQTADDIDGRVHGVVADARTFSIDQLEGGIRIPREGIAGATWDDGWGLMEGSESAFPDSPIVTVPGKVYQLTVSPLDRSVTAEVSLAAEWSSGGVLVQRDELVSRSLNEPIELLIAAPVGADGLQIGVRASTSDARIHVALSESHRRDFSLREFGAAGDGVVDDKPALLRALRAAPCTVRLTAGQYRMSADDEEIIVPEGVSLIGDGAGVTRVTMTTGLRPIEGGFKAEGIRFYCPRYSGDNRAIQADFSDGLDHDVSGFTVLDCEFQGFFYSTYFASASYDDASDPEFAPEFRVRDIKVRGCKSTTYRSANAGHFQNIGTENAQYTGNSTYGGNWSSSYNFIGGNGYLVVANNYSDWQNHGACEIENNSSFATVTGNTFDAEIWVDDSEKVTITGNRVAGPIRLTIQTHKLRDIQVSGNVCTSVEICRFGSGGQNALAASSGISVAGNLISGTGDIVTSRFGVFVSDDIGRLRDVTVANNTLTGEFVESAMRIEQYNPEMVVMIHGNNLAGSSNKLIDCPVVTKAARVLRAFNLDAVLDDNDGIPDFDGAGFDGAGASALAAFQAALV